MEIIPLILVLAQTPRPTVTLQGRVQVEALHLQAVVVNSEPALRQSALKIAGFAANSIRKPIPDQQGWVKL